MGTRSTHLRDALLVLPSIENGPRNATGIFALKEQTLALAILEAEDLAVSTDVELALYIIPASAMVSSILSSLHSPDCLRPVGVTMIKGCAPCQGRSFDR